MARVALILSFAASVCCGGPSHRFDQLDGILKSFDVPLSFGHNISLIIGDESGELYSYTNGEMTMTEKRLLGSGSKWAATTALLAMIHAANASLDDKISKYLSYWTTDPADPRSQVTLRHFMTMTSGMVTDGTDGAMALNCTNPPPFNCSDGKMRAAVGPRMLGSFFGCAVPALNNTHSECVQQLYKASPAIYPPGKYFAYATLTFQYVAAAMEVALGKPIDELLKTYFLHPLNFTGTWTSRGSSLEPKFIVNPRIPLLGGGLSADALEMSRFMRRMLRRDFLPLALHEEQEHLDTTYAQFSTQNAIFGPYGMGIWGECLFGGDKMSMPPPCAAAKRITHPGCYGYWDFVSRRDGYYYSFLPSYTCSRANQWCGTGHPPPTPESCPEIAYSLTFKNAIQGFLDDLFVGKANKAVEGGGSGASPSTCS